MDIKEAVEKEIVMNVSHLISWWQEINVDTFINALCEYAEDEEDEVMQWILVSEWLGQRLKDAGEIVIAERDQPFYLGPIWGRKVFGQPIEQDDVIKNIFEEV